MALYIGAKEWIMSYCLMVRRGPALCEYSVKELCRRLEYLD